MPRRQRTHTLKQLCLRNVAANMKDVWAKDYMDNYLNEYHFLYLMGPFNELASSLVQDLLQLLGETRRLNRAFLHLLLVPHLLELSLRSCSGLVSNAIGQIIRTRCQGLTALDLHGCSRIQSHALADLVERLPRLRKLTLSGTQCDGRVLSVVGRGCRELRELDVSRCRELTPLALPHLVYDGSRGTFHPLRLRQLRAEDTSPSPTEAAQHITALAFPLLALPGLEYVTHTFLLEALALIHQRHFGKGREFLQAGGFPSLAEVAQRGEWAGSDASLCLRRLDVASGHDLSILTSTCSEVEEVAVARDEGLEGLWQLAAWGRLTHLTLECCGLQGWPLSDVTLLLSHLGPRLQLLSLLNFHFEASLGDILGSCPNLRVFQAQLHPPPQKLEWLLVNEEAVAQQGDEGHLSPASWTFLHLKDFSMRLLDPLVTPAPMPQSLQLFLGSALVSVLTGSPQLCKLSLVNIPLSLDRVFQPVLDPPASLAQLTEVCVAHSAVSSATIGQLMAADNQLSALDLRHCPDIHRHHFEQFVKEARRRKFDLKILWE